MTWTLERAQAHLLSREQFGMRLGLERIRALLRRLDSPQDGLRAIHVVGTNGKSSTARFAADLLSAQGLRAGAYVSPHLASFAERVRIDGSDCDPGRFAAAVERAAGAAEGMESGRAPDDRVTQFELLTAAALWLFAEEGTEAVAVEAGLGGRLDATNVLGAEVVALTNVSLEHTEWLGETVGEIAAEKLAVVGEGAALVVGDAGEETMAAVRRRLEETGARLRVATELRQSGLSGYQRANFGLAVAAVEALSGPLAPAAVAAAAASARVPGRLQVLAGEPPVVFDGAHNPAGIAALLRALDDVCGRRERVVVAGVLADKDARRMLARLLPGSRAAVLTASGNPRSLAPEALRALAAEVAPHLPAEAVGGPPAALARARELAGADGCVVVCGSLHLVGELVSGSDRVAAAR